VDDILRGSQVRLAAVTNDDVGTIGRWRSDGEMLRYFDAVPAIPQSPAQIESWLQSAQSSTTGYVFGVRLLSDDRLIGLLELDGILWSQRVAWLSLFIGDEADRGKGCATDAMEVALRFGFHEVNLHRLQVTIFEFNQRSIALADRLGVVREGAYREFLERDGRRYDMLLYGLLRAEWEQRLQP
jgi:RimJ/RimL family protein N-acetyltransferase